MSKELTQLVAGLVHEHDETIAVAPAFIATKALMKLDRARVTRSAFPLIWEAAHDALQQIARGLLRAHFEDKDEDPDEAHPMFPGLQRRYPAAPSDGDQPRYILLEHLTDQDVLWNVQRLRKESAAKAKHAERLQQWAADHGLVA